MVGVSTIIAVLATLLISLVGPVAALIIYGVKNKGQGIWSAWLIGAAGFFVAQLLIRTPILNILAAMPWFYSFVNNHYILYCLITAASAALFETAARYAAAKIMRKNLTYKRGIAAGMGHGGIEAMALIGVAYINNMIYIIMIKSGSFDSVVKQAESLGADTSSLKAIKDALVNSSSSLFYFAGYERILTMILHVALSLLVCYFVMHKKDVKGILICFGAHCFVDFISPLVNGLASGYLGNLISQTAAYIIIYVFLTVVAAGSILLIKRIAKRERSSESTQNGAHSTSV